jgi:hypothetical protein
MQVVRPGDAGIEIEAALQLFHREILERQPDHRLR